MSAVPLVGVKCSSIVSVTFLVPIAGPRSWSVGLFLRSTLADAADVLRFDFVDHAVRLVDGLYSISGGRRYKV
jgi:hypothetical protein